MKLILAIMLALSPAPAWPVEEEGLPLCRCRLQLHTGVISERASPKVRSISNGLVLPRADGQSCYRTSCNVANVWQGFARLYRTGDELAVQSGPKFGRSLRTILAKDDGRAPTCRPWMSREGEFLFVAEEGEDHYPSGHVYCQKIHSTAKQKNREFPKTIWESK